MTHELKFIFDRLFAFYKVATITELSQCLGMSQPAVTNWQRRNSISAIKKKCRELGIYDEIFRDYENINSINDLIENRNNTLHKINLFQKLDINYSEKLTLLKSHCKEFDIQITEIKNLRMLYLFEHLLNDVERINKVEELEDDIKRLMLKYDTRLAEDEQTTNLFYSFLEEQIKNFEDKFKK